jgi:hypothetical protein
VVVAVGETVALPAGIALPIPWSMLTSVAPDTLHSIVAVLPGVMFEGLALNESMVGKSMVGS